jgi:hypothetical protein
MVDQANVEASTRPLTIRGTANPDRLTVDILSRLVDATKTYRP